MASAVVDGITTRYGVLGSGLPLLMFSPGGFDATIDKWRTQSIYARIKLLDHLPKKYTCIVFDRRRDGRIGRPGRATWNHYVEQAKGLLDHLNIRRAHRRARACCSPAVAFGVAFLKRRLSLDAHAGRWAARSTASTAISTSRSTLHMSSKAAWRGSGGTREEWRQELQRIAWWTRVSVVRRDAAFAATAPRQDAAAYS